MREIELLAITEFIDWNVNITVYVLSLTANLFNLITNRITNKYLDHTNEKNMDRLKKLYKQNGFELNFEGVDKDKFIFLQKRTV